MSQNNNDNYIAVSNMKCDNKVEANFFDGLKMKLKQPPRSLSMQRWCDQ